jgi:hypothetical protein
MTIKTLSFAALFFAGTVAATASLTSFSPEPAHSASASQSSQAGELTSRGTRAPLVSVTDADAPVGDQPRRGTRADVDPVAVALSTHVADGLRRGTR